MAFKIHAFSKFAITKLNNLTTTNITRHCVRNAVDANPGTADFDGCKRQDWWCGCCSVHRSHIHRGLFYASRMPARLVELSLKSMIIIDHGFYTIKKVVIIYIHRNRRLLYEYIESR